MIFKWIVGRVHLNLGMMHLYVAAIGGNRWRVLCIEVDGGHFAETAQRLLDTGSENLPDGHLVLKLDFSLGRMDVDVDGLGLDSETQEVIGLLALGNELLIGRHHGLMEIGMTHVAPVDKHELQGITLAGILGLADVALHLHQRRVNVHGQQLLVHVVAHQGSDALTKGSLHQLIHHVAVVNEREFHLVVDKGQLLKFLDDIAQLHLVALEEFAASRHIEEEVLDHEIAAHWAHVRFLTLTLRGVDDQLGAQLGVTAACAQFHLGDGGYRGQSLAAETHRVQREQVLGIAYLAGAMAFKGQACVGLAHPHPVVDNLDECAARILEDNLDVGCLGINGVLHQFLDDTGRALDDFAGSNLVGYRIGQQFNHITHGSIAVWGVVEIDDGPSTGVKTVVVALLPERRRVPPSMLLMSCLSSSLTS